MAKKKNENYHIVQLKLATNDNDIKLLEKRFHIAEVVYNQVIKHCRKQYNRFVRDARDKNAKGKERTDLIKEYGLTKFQLFGYSKIIGKKYKKHLDSKIIQCISKRAYTSVDKVLYGGGKYIHFKKFGDLDTIEIDTNINRLRYENGIVYFNGHKIKVRNNSLNNPYNKQAMKGNIKYCRIKKLSFNTGYHYYIQLIMEGNPPTKSRKIGNGDVGIDIGTSTIAVSSQKEVILKELAPLNNKYIKEIKSLQQKMDRSKRTSNPDNYNDDGTIKKGIKLKWVFSKSYRKLRMRVKTLFRKRSAYIKQEHEILANRIISLGNTIYVEDMNFKALQKKAKQSKVVNGKNTKRKRFGASLQKRAPAMLISIIDQKLKYFDTEINKVNTRTFKASQYNHIEDIYTPKKLYERSTIINNQWVQRDLYSSFLLMNSNENLNTTNRDKCISRFNNFVKLHNICIEENRNKPHPNSFGF